MSNIESTKGEIVMYQPDETIRLEVRVESETVWINQAQMAELFGTKRPAITKHLNNIYKCEELSEESTCSILEHMGNDGFPHHRRCGLRLWGQLEGCRKETLRLHPHARNLSLGSTE
jgi:hypothetical protein